MRFGHQLEDGKCARYHAATDTRHPRRRSDRIGAPATSWCDPAGASPAQVGSSVRLVASVAWPLATVVRSVHSDCMGCGIEPRNIDIAGAESFHSLEGNMCGTAMRGADALPGSKATSRAKGSYRNLGDLVSGRRRRVRCPEYGGPHREGEEP